jgi:indole-3-glycerol phosphate synthase
VTSVAETGTILDRIIAQTQVDLKARQARVSREDLQRQFLAHPAPVDVRASLDQETVTVIAEIKRASPSRGRFAIEIDPATIAAEYVHGGASAISCLTDTPFFQGSLEDLGVVAAVTECLPKPVGVLRKDFMIDQYQVDEARAFGASCILLIVACLSDELMQDLHDYATSLGLTVLVEVHDRYELDRALTIGSHFIGVNNRNLKSFEVDLNVTLRLAPHVPADVVLVGESGIFTADHVQLMAQAGVDAILVGESLILQEDRVAAVSALAGVEKSGRG